LSLLVTSIMYSQINSAKESINSFSFKLFKEINSKNENCFFSPYSVFGALSMTMYGAKDNTRQEIEKVLEIKETENVYSDFKNLTANISLNREFQFLSSNSIWLQNKLKIEKEYSKKIEENYQAKSKSVDFTNENNREKARKEINTWVEKQTNSNILEFIKPGILSESTSMVLINAVYFSALWDTEFLLQNTKDEKFLSAKGDSVNCKMMNTEIKANYFHDEFAQVLEIPYEKNKVSLIVVLPESTVKNDLSVFNNSYLNQAIQSFESRNVKLSLPSFKMDVDYDLAEVMKKLGMKSAFENGADFSGITGQKDLFITSLLHKSIIEVSEKGTKASSTTAVIATRSTLIAKEPVNFNANHPFVFILKDNTTGVILFMGYLAMPK
jgi:serpin B